MRNVADLIDQLGPPPKEVCLDWQKQLQRFPTTERPVRQSSWQDFTVDRQGQLVPIQSLESVGISSSSQGRLIEQLGRWAADSDQQFAARTKPKTARLKTARTNTGKSHLAGLRTASGNPERSRTWRRTIALKPIGLAVLSMVVVACIAIFWPKHDGQIVANSSLAQSSGSPATMAKVSLPRDNVGRDKPTIEQPADLASSTTDREFLIDVSRQEPDRAIEASVASRASLDMTAPTDSVAESAGNLPESTGNGIDWLERLSDTSIPGNETKRFELGAGPEDRRSFVEEREQTENSSVGYPDSTETGDAVGDLPETPTQLPELDIAVQLNRLTDSPVLPEEAADDLASSAELDHAWSLPLWPATQIQRMSGRPFNAIRKPHWRLRIVPPAGLSVEPEAWVTIVGGDAALWKIAATDTERLDLKIVIAARLQSRRSPSLLWRVFGGADDVPQITLPLQRDMLGQIPAILNSSRQSLELAARHFDALRRENDVSTEIRSLASARGRWIQSQLQICERLADLTKQAQLQVGVLDGSFEVHAELSDLADPSAGILMHWGDAEVGESVPNMER